jgi:hypothetical protein
MSIAASGPESASDARELPPGFDLALANVWGRRATVHRVMSRPADHRVDNMTTASLHHVTAETDLGTARLFVKVLRPATKSPLMEWIPIEHHADVMVNLNWLDEPRAYRSGIGGDLPDGLRMPVIHALVEEPEQIVMWLEDVTSTQAWTLECYRSAASLLAHAAVRWPESRLSRVGIGRRSYGYLFFGKLMNYDIPALRSPNHWSHPDLESLGGGDLCERTERLIAAAPKLLATIDQLPHGLAHGDATPHNFLPKNDGTIVAVDWSYVSADAIGADLGQLFAGRFDVGNASAEYAPAVADAILDGYLAGLREAGATAVSESEVIAAWAISLAFRSVISSTLIDHQMTSDPNAHRKLLAARVAVAKLGLDLLDRVDLI